MRRRLKHLLPRSLFGRAALILIMPIIMIQLIVSLNFIQRHFEDVTRQMTEGVSIELRSLLQQIAAAPDMAEARHSAAATGRSLDLAVVFPADAAAVPQDRRAFLDWSGRTVILTLHEGLQGLVSVDLATTRGEALLSFETPHGPLQVSLSRRRVSASNPHQLLVVMALASALMTLIAYIFLRNQLTPITRLARAAEAFGKGRTMLYRPRGATEVRAAGNAFLDMRARIERQIEQRTLLLSGVSHDLRTPLTRLKLGLAFLPEDAEQRAMLQDVAQMERLVEEFLAFARGDAMEEPALTDPVQLVRQAVGNASRAGQTVSLGTAEGEGMVRLRPQSVLRALENLIGNGVRYGNRVVVSLWITERNLRIIIEDDGPGIPEKQRDEAMIPFKRLDEARDPNRGGGVGLGLSIASDVARSHGGVLRLGQSEALGGLRAEFVIAR